MSMTAGKARLIANIRVSSHIHISRSTNSCKERGKKKKALSSNYVNVHVYCFGSFPFELLAMNDIPGIIIVRFGYLFFEKTVSMAKMVGLFFPKQIPILSFFLILESGLGWNGKLWS